jgi:hypothetical protein
MVSSRTALNPGRSPSAHAVDRIRSFADRSRWLHLVRSKAEHFHLVNQTIVLALSVTAAIGHPHPVGHALAQAERAA